MNVILILSDTFRQDLLEGRFKIKKKSSYTPHLDRFLKDSINFTRAYHASFPTVPNRADIYTGRYTLTFYDWSPLPRNWTILPQILSEYGYVTMMINNTPHILKDGYNFDRGFNGWIWIRGQENDRYRTYPRHPELPCDPSKLRKVESTLQHLRNNYGRRREEEWMPAKTAKAACEWLEENYREDFFLYIDFFDPHEPWDPPEWYKERFNPGYEGEEVIYPIYGPSDYLSEEELTHIRALYAAEAMLVDRWVGEIIETADNLGLLENTIIIFTSDHGFYLGEHNLIGKSIIFKEFHGLAPLYEEVAHIPLIVRFADELSYPHGVECDSLVQTPDITATILSLLHAEPPPNMDGYPLQKLLEREAERSIAVSSPSLIHGLRAGIRVTVTSKEWSLILAPQRMKAEETREYTYIVDGEKRVLKTLGDVRSELYHLPSDPNQKKNVIQDRKDIADLLHQEFLRVLAKLSANSSIYNNWKDYKI